MAQREKGEETFKLFSFIRRSLVRALDFEHSHFPITNWKCSFGLQDFQPSYASPSLPLQQASILSKLQ